MLKRIYVQSSFSLAFLRWPPILLKTGAITGLIPFAQLDPNLDLCESKSPWEGIEPTRSSMLSQPSRLWAPRR